MVHHPGSFVEIIPRSVRALHIFSWHYFFIGAIHFITLKNNCMPQKNHDKAAKHNDEAAKHHRTASKHAQEGNHEKAAQHAQAAQGHQQKANEHSGKAASKYAEKAGTMKKEDMDDDDNTEMNSSNGNDRKSNKN
jgi:hypothetical protein